MNTNINDLNPDMEEDMNKAEWFISKVKKHDYYAQNLYAAICNNEFQKLEVLPILKDQTWSASWRYAGGIVARIRCFGDYMDWYCSGMGGVNFTDPNDGDEWMSKKKYVPESVVTDEIREDLQKLGWKVLD